MARTLLIMRHAKSDWEHSVANDFGRPLAARGRRDAPRIGRWLRLQGHVPGEIIASPAKRARETADAVRGELSERPLPLRFDERIYAAALTDLRAVLADVQAPTKTVLLIGHNPGLEELLEYLTAGALPEGVEADKLMPTAAVAGIILPDSWATLPRGCGTCAWTIRPKQLDA